MIQKKKAKEWSQKELREFILTPTLSKVKRISGVLLNGSGKPGVIQIEDLTLNTRLEFFSFTASEIHFYGTKINSLHFSYINLERLIIHDCSFNKQSEASIELSSNINDKLDVSIHKPKMLKSLFSTLHTKLSHLHIKLTDNVKSIDLKGKINGLTIDRPITTKDIILENNVQEEELKTVLNHKTIEELKLSGPHLKSVDLLDLKIETLSIINTSKDVEITIIGTEVNRLILKNFISEFSLGFSELISHSKHVLLQDLDINVFGRLEPTLFYLPTVEFGFGVKYTGSQPEIQWPKELFGTHKQNQQGYKLIKDYMIEHGDYELESYYHSKELESYYKYQKGKVKGLKSRFDFSFKVGLPYAVSGFGQSLAQPLAWLLGLHIVFTYLMIVFSGDVLNLKPAFDISWEAFTEGAKYWAYSILPTHRLSYNGQMMNPIISLLMRISSSIFIYHIILASRKHLKT